MLSRRRDWNLSTPTIFEGRYRLRNEIIKSVKARLHSARDHQAGQRIAFKTDKARVFLADDLVTGKEVAVKILNRWSVTDTQLRTRFERDAQIIHSFEHPNVVKMFVSGVTQDGQPYFVMEYLRGQTLGEEIAEKGRISPITMADYLESIASALDAAHSRGIVHRDITPYSIMLQSDVHGKTVVKILDFGLAKDLSNATASEAELTGKGTILGTAAYMSPELARGEEVSQSSDIYSLGVSLYEALTGRLPFEGKTDFQLILAHINSPIPPFPKGWSQHSRASAIEAVVLKALSKEPASRPTSGSDLAVMFRKALLPSLMPAPQIPWVVFAAGVGAIAALVVLANWLF
jgi:serine/threonine protein kinase